jgi:hypothetical protein
MVNEPSGMNARVTPTFNFAKHRPKHLFTPSDCPAPEKSKQKRLIPAGSSTGSSGNASHREPAFPWQKTMQGNDRFLGLLISRFSVRSSISLQFDGIKGKSDLLSGSERQKLGPWHRGTRRHRCPPPPPPPPPRAGNVSI